MNETLNSDVYADTVQELRKVTGGATTRVAILGGYFNRGDGGGGLFYWDTTEAVDNGGTILNQNAGAGGVAQAGWRRVFSGALNVQWFGAIPTVIPNSGPAIQAAIATAYQQQYHREIYFPAGEYNTTESIVIPRGPGISSFSIRGDGIHVTQIVGGTLLPAGQPVITFGTEAFTMYGFRLEGMTVARLQPGPVFVHVPIPNVPEPYTVFNAVFRDLRFLSNDPFGGPYSTYPAVLIHGLRDSVFQNVQSEGGDAALMLRDSARCTFTNFVVGPRSQYCRSGIVIVGGGGHIFNNTTVGPVGSNAYPGDGMVFAPSSLPGQELWGPRQCIVNLVQFEGRHTRDALKIEAGSELVFINVSPPGHRGDVTHRQRGIWISPIVRHVRFIGGWCNNYTGGFAGSCAIEVANGAKDIYFDEVGISQPYDQPYLSEVTFPDPLSLSGPPGSGEAGGELLSERVRGYFTFGIYEPHVTAGTIAVGMISVLGQGPAASVKGHDVWRVAENSTAIHTLKHGYDGQKLTLLGQAAGPEIVSGVGNIVLSTATFELGHPTSTLQLIYDRRNDWWLEVSRSPNQAAATVVRQKEIRTD